MRESVTHILTLSLWGVFDQHSFYFRSEKKSSFSAGDLGFS